MENENKDFDLKKTHPFFSLDNIPNKDYFEKEVNSMILSASGWRKIFVKSGTEEDKSEEIGIENTFIAALIANVFADYIIEKCGNDCKIAVGIDARPTGPIIADTMIRVLTAKKIKLQFLSITAAPEIMAYSRTLDGFVYISASHNPIGHNGIKFGLNDGGVLPGTETAKLTEAFLSLCNKDDCLKLAINLVKKAPKEIIEKIYLDSEKYKQSAVDFYKNFTSEVVSGTKNKDKQKEFFEEIKENVKNKPLTIVCDMNGSARTVSIDKNFLQECGLGFISINDKPRQIVHAIIPEPENLIYCATEMEKLKVNDESISLGYMPDCDGDRGNIVYWNNKTQKAEVLKAQEVFALSVLAELSYIDYQVDTKKEKIGISVNDPTSMRIEDIAKVFNATVFRAEVGEANVVNLAREARNTGFNVPILGEGSNGGNITHPAAVRDPINTIFALIKLLVIKDKKTSSDNKLGLFHRWCIKSNQENLYKEDFTLTDIIETLPMYTTTGVSEQRALLKINSKNHSKLKSNFQKIFEKEWTKKQDELQKRFGIYFYEAVCNNGTKETRNLQDYSLSGKGGLKILLKDKNYQEIAFIWMRGSGTEPVFRILCDVKGNNPEMEKELLEWETEMLLEADKI